ncbi:transmembrane protein 180-like [Convolutriloba macropyga]|uniref:transmembrane protein 180-like n=1 Tax=Convolutriloba macropyga TaxID=536237 RepID=UPI003F51E0C4
MFGFRCMMKAKNGILSRFTLDNNFLCFAFCTFAANLMSSVFGFYYVYYFLDVYKVSHSCFQFAQFLFLIWNAINDPIFGWIQDHSSAKWIRSRQLNILYGAPLFGLSFLYGWFPIYEYFPGSSEYWKCTHLVITLCFWDTMFSFVLLAHCSLFAEVTTDHTSRVRLTQYTRSASICGLFAVPLVEFCYETYGDTGFYVCLIFIAIVATIFMCMTGLYTKSVINRIDELPSADEPSFFSRQYLKLNLEILLNRNFLCFVTMNFLTVGLGHFAANFTKIFSEDLQLFSESKSNKILFFFFNSIGGNSYILLLSPLIMIYGSHMIACASFFLVLLSSVVLYFYRTFAMIVTQIIVLNVVAHGIGGLTDVFVSSLIDEDMVRYKRRLPISSMFFGLNALVTKPAQSLFPMLAVFFLDMTKIENKDGKTVRSQEAIVTLMCVLPMITALLQLIIFTPFRMNIVTASRGGNSTKMQVDLSKDWE